MSSSRPRSDRGVASAAPEREAEAAADASTPCTRASCRREREELMERLAHQQRVAQVGLVTAGLAHDLGNHVQSISGAVFLALMSQRSSEWRAALEQIQERCCSMTDVTRAFLSFVRRREEVTGSFSVEGAITEVCRLVRPLAAAENVTLEHVIAADATIDGERQLLVQAIVNLVSNGVRACGAGGRVGVRLSHPMPRLCRIEVTDDGPGIPDEVRGRLFRPFATSHGDGGGNGLGLFIVRRSIRDLGGSIRVVTSGDGTTFTIDLPVCG